MGTLDNCVDEVPGLFVTKYLRLHLESPILLNRSYKHRLVLPLSRFSFFEELAF